MLRSLIWKEWREQRPVALAGIGLAASMPLLIAIGLTLADNQSRIGETAGLLPIANWVLLWPLAAVATAATTLAADRDGGRLSFLLSRPAPRWLLLGVKLGVALGVVGMIVVSGQLVSVIVSSGLQSVFPVDPEAAETIPFDAFDPVVRHGTVVFAVLAFAVALALSLVLSTSLAIAGIGTLGALALFGGNAWLWSRIDYVPIGGPALTMGPPLLLALGLLTAAFVAFERGELLRGRSHLRRVLGIGSTLVILWVAGVGSLGAWEMRPPGDSFVVSRFSAAPDSAFLAVSIARPDRAASRTVAILHPDGRLERIGSRLTDVPTVSPDGRRVAYVGSAGAAGFRSAYRALLIWDRQTRRERALAWRLGPFRTQYPPAFSPDSRYVAVTLDNDIVIADVDGAAPPRIPLIPSGQRHCHLDGWSVPGGMVVRTCGRIVDLIDPANGSIVRRIDPEPGTRVRPVPGRRYMGNNSRVLGLHLTRNDDAPRYTGAEYRHAFRLLQSDREIPLLGGAPLAWSEFVRALTVTSGPGSAAVLVYTARRRVAGEDGEVRYEGQVRTLDLVTAEDVLLDRYSDSTSRPELAWRESDRELMLLSEVDADGANHLLRRTYDPFTGRRLDSSLLRLGDTSLDLSLVHSGRLLYPAEPVRSWRSHEPDELEDRYLRGWYRSLRSLDLLTGDDERLVSGLS